MITIAVGKEINNIDVKKHLNLENTIFINEIERGYHYTEYKRAWRECIDKLDYLITTQSLEMIKALCLVSDELSFDFQIVRFSKDELGLHTTRFGAKEAKFLINEGLEIR
jgi:hypothetical protein